MEVGFCIILEKGTLKIGGMDLLDLFQKRKETFSGYFGSGHVGSDVGDRDESRAAFYDQRSFDPRLRHDDMVSFFPLDCKAF